MDGRRTSKIESETREVDWEDWSNQNLHRKRDWRQGVIPELWTWARARAVKLDEEALEMYKERKQKRDEEEEGQNDSSASASCPTVMADEWNWLNLGFLGWTLQRQCHPKKGHNEKDIEVNQLFYVNNL